MAYINEASNDLTVLEGLIESRLRGLEEKLRGPYKLQDIVAELKALSDLVQSFTITDKLLEQLLDNKSREEKRATVLIKMRMLRGQIGRELEDLKQLRERSHKLTERSQALIAKAQQTIIDQAQRAKVYTQESCFWCEGTGRDDSAACAPCQGKGIVSVRLPSTKCKRCRTTGTEAYRSARNFPYCVDCGGTGWLGSNPI